MKKIIPAIALLAVILAVILFLLYRIHPAAPLMLLLSLAVQVPIVILVARAALGGSYRQRAQQRLLAYQAGGAAQQWLNEENAEANTTGYKYWSTSGKALLALNRAQAAYAAGRTEQAASHLDNLQMQKLNQQDMQRFQLLTQQLASGKPYNKDIFSTDFAQQE